MATSSGPGSQGGSESSAVQRAFSSLYVLFEKSFSTTPLDVAELDQLAHHFDERLNELANTLDAESVGTVFLFLPASLLTLTIPFCLGGI